MLTALAAGFLTGLSLIVAIGAQNAFVLRQGLRREHVGAVVALCAGSDVVLIALGVAGFNRAAERLPWLGPVMLWGGVAFLLGYGALRFRAAAKGGEVLAVANGGAVALKRVVLTCLTLTWLNPHVYLDTLALLGALSAQYAPFAAWFGVGAASASAAFFAALGYGARLLAPVLARPGAWVVVEVLIGAVMWMSAASLIVQGGTG